MDNLRALWLAIIVLLALIFGASAGVLSWVGGTNTAKSILTGGGAGATTLLVAATAAHFLTNG